MSGAETAPPTAFDDLLARVGRLNYAWTNTESLLIHLIAGLMATDNEAAVVVFLTLTTARGRIDLVERLAKLDRVDGATRDIILGLTRRLSRFSALRNHYSHCLYSFDQSGAARTILMRVADRRDSIRMGRSTAVDADALSEIDAAIAALGTLNRDIWGAIRALDFPA